MAASGFTQLSLYSSTTAAAVPLSANLANGELAINITDGKLYYKNNLGVVTLLADKNYAAGTVPNLTVSGTFAANGGVTLGDTIGDAFTINSGAVSVPNGLNFSSNTLVIDAANNRIGVGVATPTVALDVSGTVKATTGDFTTLTISSLTLPGALIANGTFAANGGVTLGDNIGDAFTINSGAVSVPNGLSFDSGTLVIDAANNRVGVGVAAPTVALDVLGAVNGSTDASFYNVRVGRGGSGIVSNTAVGLSALSINTTGSGNTAVGRIALSSNQGGNNNTAVGDNALTSNSGGSSNTAAGANAMRLNVSGSFNSAFGSQALTNNLTGTINSAFGNSALSNNTTGGGNTAIGSSALQANTSANNNTAVGAGALQSNSTGSTNTAVGYQALFLNTLGGANTAVGVSALQNNSTGGNNTAVGRNALASNTTASGNTAVGDAALNNNTFGSSNVAVGEASMSFNTSGTSNTAVGRSALQFNTVGQYNTAIGAQALQNNTANFNTALGHQTLVFNTTGSGNVALGYLAMFNNTTGFNNIGIGPSVLGANTTGNSNVAVGFNSLSANTSGASNVAVGFTALTGNTSGEYNVGLGQSALSGVTTGRANTGISPLTNTGAYSPVFNPTTENNRFCMGSTAVTNAYIQVAWTVVSDARDKTDFAPVPHGLDFVNKLNPIAYRYKETRDATEGHGPVRYGFKAQDVLALEGDKPVIVDAEDSEKLRFNDQSMIAVLVNAINELTAEVNELKAKLPK